MNFPETDFPNRKAPHEPKKARQGQREAWVKDQVKKIFIKYGITYYMPTAAIYGRAGASDFIAWLPPSGHGVLVETKADLTNKMTPLQLKFFAEAERVGVSCMLVHRGNLVQFETWLQVLLETFK